MCPSRKRVCSKNDEGENVRAESSYTKMKVKMEKYEFELEQLRMELLEAKKPTVEVDVVMDKVGIEQQVPERSKRGSSKEGQNSYSKLKVKWKSSMEELAHIHILLQESNRKIESSTRRRKDSLLLDCSQSRHNGANYGRRECTQT